jgi:hypothetical protein
MRRHAYCLMPSQHILQALLNMTVLAAAARYSGAQSATT